MVDHVFRRHEIRCLLISFWWPSSTPESLFKLHKNFSPNILIILILLSIRSAASFQEKDAEKPLQEKFPKHVLIYVIICPERRTDL
jgi:hypothetical protein